MIRDSNGIYQPKNTRFKKQQHKNSKTTTNKQNLQTKSKKTTTPKQAKQNNNSNKTTTKTHMNFAVKVSLTISPVLRKQNELFLCAVNIAT